MVHNEQLIAMCGSWTLGALDEPERLELEQHLAEGCPECEAELSRLADGLALLAAAAPAVAAPAGLKGRVLELVRREGRVPAAGGDATSSRVIPLPTRRRPSFATWGWAAAAVLLAVTSVVTWRVSQRLEGELAAARRQLAAGQQQLAERQQQLAERQQQLADERRWSALLEGEGTRVVDLKLTPSGAAVLRARAIYDPETRRAVIVFVNFTPPAGSDYQLWALRGGQPASLGLIHADVSGRAVVKLPDIGDTTALAAFAVSLEKAGGSSSPTAPEGPVVMVGKLAGL